MAPAKGKHLKLRVFKSLKITESQHICSFVPRCFSLTGYIRAIFLLIAVLLFILLDDMLNCLFLLNVVILAPEMLWMVLYGRFVG